MSTRCGHVRVYTYNDDTPGWEQRGEDINGDFRNPIQSGWSVALSGDGKVVVVGAGGPQYYQFADKPEYVRVNHWDGTKWGQRGTDIYGNNPLDYFGHSTALSGDGNTLATGAHGGDSPYVRVLHWNGTNWNQHGGDIYGDGGEDRFGWSVSLSMNGDTIAIGAPYDGKPHDTTLGEKVGSVRVYTFKEGVWTTVGGDINGVEELSESGTSVSLSLDASYVVVGAPKSGGYNIWMSGQTRVYQLLSIWDLDTMSSTNMWVQAGQAINGEVEGEKSGTSVSYLSYKSESDKTKRLVAIGSMFPRVYQLDNENVWNKIGGEITLASEPSVSLKYSAAQNEIILAVGAPVAYDLTGHVRVYAFNGDAWNQMGRTLHGEESRDYSGTSVSLSSDGKTLAVGAYGNDCEYPPPFSSRAPLSTTPFTAASAFTAASVFWSAFWSTFWSTFWSPFSSVCSATTVCTIATIFRPTVLTPRR